jgi:CBS domain-containing protein
MASGAAAGKPVTVLSFSHDELAAAAAAIIGADAWCVLELCVDPARQQWEPRLVVLESDPGTVAAAIAEELAREPSVDARICAYDRTTLMPLAGLPSHLCQVAVATALDGDLGALLLTGPPAEVASISGVRNAMNSIVVTLGPDDTLREAARRMTSRGVGAAVVVGSESRSPMLLTERDILRCNGTGRDVDTEHVRHHAAKDRALIDAEWPLARAAEVMTRDGRRHAIVVDGVVVVGILSMRDIVRCWTSEGASCDLPES